MELKLMENFAGYAPWELVMAYEAAAKAAPGKEVPFNALAAMAALDGLPAVINKLAIGNAELALH